MDALDRAFDTLDAGPADALDQAFDALDQEAAASRNAARIETRDTTPDQYGEAVRLGRQTGVPTPVAVKNIDTIRQDAEKAEFDSVVSQSPTLGRWLQKPENMGVGKDDLRALLHLEGTVQRPVLRSDEFGEKVKEIRARQPGITWDQARAVAAKQYQVNNIDPLIGPTTGRKATFGNFIKGLAESVPASFEQARTGLNLQAADVFGDEAGAAGYLRQYEEQQATLDNAVPAFESDEARAIFGGVQSTIQQVPGLALSVATGNPGPALAGMSVQAQAQAYGKYRDRGGDPGESFLGATGEGIVEGATELLPMGTIVNKFGKVGAKRFIGELLAKELPGEQIATVAQDAIDTAVANPEKTWGEYLAERPDAAYQTLVSTLTQAAITGGASGIVERYAGDELRRQQAATDETSRIAASTADAAKLDAMTQAGAALKTSDRSPEAVEEFVREAGQTGSVYVDAVQMREFFQSAGLDPLVTMGELTGDTAQVTEALATGGDLIIPMDRYIARVSKAEYAADVARLARLDPTRLSAADLESPELQKQIQGIVESQPEEKAEPDPVFDTIRTQLTAAGRSKAEADAGARLMSDAFERRAQRRGKGEKAADLYKASGLEIVGAAGASPVAADTRTLAQEAAKATETPEFRNWFGESAVKDESGKPILVYHGTSSEDFDAFDTNDRGAWFGEDPRTASMYAIGNDTMVDGAKRGENPLPRVVPAYLSIKNPYVVTPEDWKAMRGDSKSYQDKQRELTKRVKALGHDGINYGDGVWTVFEPEQIKSAFNKGTFDANDPRILHQPAYHGTPHDFDRFSTDFMGTGEGAQAFGWGLYFSEREGVAEGYREALAGEDHDYYVDGKVMPWEEFRQQPLLDKLAMQAVSREGAYADVVNTWRDQGVSEERIAPLEAKIAEYKGRVDYRKNKKGALYRVDIPDEAVAKFLDWDAPLSKQSEAVQDALDDVMRKNMEFADVERFERDWATATGEQFYKVLSASDPGVRDDAWASAWARKNGGGNDKAASLALKAAGIPGIKFFDGGSRSKGDGTRNLVVIDDSLIEITHKNGKPVTKKQRAEAIKQFEQSRDLSQADGSGPRARIELREGAARIVLTDKSDRSSFFHEAGHLFLEQMIEDAQVNPDLAADLDTVLAWVGSDGRTKDGPEAVRAAIQTDQHEQFARGFEAYLREGKAPTLELKKLFAAFKRWLTQLYRDIKSLNVTLSPEITAVMDRLIASEDAIAQAAAAQNYAMSLPIDEMRKLGISEEKLVAYSRSIEAAQDELSDKLMEDYQRRELGQEYRDTLKANAKAVDEETRKAKFWNDVEMLSKGKRLDDAPVPEGMVGVKVNTADAPTEILSTLKARGIVKSTGQAADYVATLLDYPSGQVMLDAMAKSPTRKQFIAAEAKRRTDAEFPDAMTDGTLENRALEALHNTRMHAALQTELNLLGELARTPVPPARAIREAAARIVASKTPAQNRPFQYLTQERKAARKAAISAAAGKYAEALVHKREQALNAALYSEALQAQKDVEKLDKLMRRLDKKSTRETVALGGQDFLIQLDQIRHVYGYTEVSPAMLEAWAPMRSWLDNLQAEGEITSVSDRVLGNVDRQRVQDSKAVKVGELREVYEASRNLMHLASQANKIRKGEELVSREEAITEMVAAAEASGLKVKTLPRSRREMTTAQVAGNTVASMGMDLLRPENIFEAMDGGETGPWHDYWFNALDRSEKAMNAFRRRIATALKKLRKATPKDFLNALDKNVTVLPGVTMKRSTLLAAVLNSGNAGNLQRLSSGGLLDDAGNPVNLTPQQVAIGRELLTDEELAYVQGLWDTVDSLWPDITQLQQRVSGVPVEKVQAASFSIRGKAYRGGYWPLVYDSQRSNVGEVQTDADALRILMGQGFTRAATPKGYQKARAEEFSAPLLLDFGAVISRHLDHVMTDLSYRETVKHVSALMRSGRIKQALLERVGQAGVDSLKGQLAYSVSASSEVAGQVARGWRRFSDVVLSNMSVSALAIRPDIALGNYASALIQGMDRTGLKGLMRGLWQSYASRGETRDLIRSKSSVMTARLDEVDHWYQQELKWTAGQKGYGPAYRRLMMTLHRAASFEVEKAIWIGRYLNEREAGKEEAEAVALADKTIRQTQTANERKDLSTFERDTSFRQTRQFMGPMFVIFGRLNEIAKAQGNSRQVGERIARMLLQVFLAPAIFALMAGRWPEDGDDDEEIGAGEWAIWTAANTLLFPLQTLPLLRDLGSAAEAALTGNPINPRAAPTTAAVTNMVKAGAGIAKKVGEYQDTDELDYFGLTRDLASIAGPLTGLPTSQIRITTKGIEAALDDDEDDRNLALLLLYGPPK